MFRAVRRSSSGAPTVFAASVLHTHVVTARSQVWGGNEFQLRLDYGRSPHAYVNQRLQILLELLMMSDVPLETCWAFNERWNDKFRYQVASCWLFLLSHITMHGSMNIKFIRFLWNVGTHLLYHTSSRPIREESSFTSPRKLFWLSAGILYVVRFLCKLFSYDILFSKISCWNSWILYLALSSKICSLKFILRCSL